MLYEVITSFPACIDYLALGHLHIGQVVAGSPTRRYSGAPSYNFV